MYCSLLLNFLHHVIRLKMILYSPVKIGSVLIIIADLKDFLWCQSLSEPNSLQRLSKFVFILYTNPGSYSCTRILEFDTGKRLALHSFYSHPAASPPLHFLSAWKDGSSGGTEELWPDALPELRRGLFFPRPIRSGAGSA